MSATESLTIEIQGDSSGLSQALDSALAKVESLQTAADNAASAAGSVGSRLASVATAMQPLQLVSQQLTRISQQAQVLSQQSITLNVQPALSALQSLMSAIQAVASRLSSLSLTGGGPIRGPVGGGAGTLGGSGGAGAASTADAASRSLTSLVVSTAPYSLDSGNGISLATGQAPLVDFVPSARRNTSPLSPSDSRGASSLSTFDQSSSTVNHFGGITIEVRETGDINALMRDLRLQGLSTRHRQG